MIYRIAIYKDGAFVRYAEPEEIGGIRVNRHGVVEKLSITYRQYTHNNERIPQMQWKDVSDTHKVEWGLCIDGKRRYENDIMHIVGGKECGATYYGVMIQNTYGFFYVEHGPDMEWEDYCDVVGYECVIGNANENPKYMSKVYK